MAALSVIILSAINAVVVFAYTVCPTIVKLPVTVTSPVIEPPELENLVLAKEALANAV